MNSNVFKKGFTLAEVLITLVVLGVVAMLAFPSLTSSYNDSEKVAKIKKNYAMLSKAMLYVRAAGGDMDMEIMDNDDVVMKNWFNEYLKPRLNTIKVCYNSKGCWNSGDTYGYNGLKVPYNYTGKGIGANTIIVILADGTLLNIDAFNYNDMKTKMGIETNGDAGLVMFFDINGEKKPNTLGKDIFVLTYVSGTGIVLPYRDKAPYDCTQTQVGYSCINKYLR